MPLDLAAIVADPKLLEKLPTAELEAVLAQAVRLQREDRQENQLLYYVPVSEPAWQFHRSMAKKRALGGGNRAGKTTTPLVEMVALATGIFPRSIAKELRPKFKGPVRCRLVVESIINTLHPIILPKLRYTSWSGLPPQGGDKGHWGWIPKQCLEGGEWDKAWSEKLRTLTVKCFDPDSGRYLGKTTIQCMSYDQDPSDFASGDFDIIHHDEPPPFAIWRENVARAMSVGGTITLAMTWPDDPGIPVDWIHDEIYELGVPGPRKDPEVEWIELDTTRNPHLDQASIAAEMRGKDVNWITTRIKGQPIRFSNRVHPLFTDVPQAWCFQCGRVVAAERDRCITCGDEVSWFCHVTEFEVARTWPCVFVLDPHPRKPHMWAHFLIDPQDDVWMVSEGALDGDTAEVAAKVEEMEEALELEVTERYMDPNMGASPASSKRGVTWQSEFDDAGLKCLLADDSDVGRKRLNEYLKPDLRTLRPRFFMHPRCQTAAYQMKRFTWAEHRRKDEKDLKEIPRAKHDDMPGLMRYLLNTNPTFRILRHGAPVLRRPGQRRGAY